MIIPPLKPISKKRLAQVEKGRNTAKYREWRDLVLARDGKRCQYPGCTNDKKIDVHHIKRFAHNKHLRTEVYNGISLCEECHGKIHGHEEYYEEMFFRIVEANTKTLKEKIKEMKENSVKNNEPNENNL